MPSPEFERALAEGAARSRAALADRPRPPSRAAIDGAHGSWLRTRVMDLWQRRKRLIVGLGLFLLFDLIAAVAAATMGTHF